MNDPEYSYQGLSWLLDLIRADIDRGTVRDIREAIEKATKKKIHPANFMKVKNWMVKYGILVKDHEEIREVGDYHSKKKVIVYKVDHDRIDHIIFSLWEKTSILWDRSQRWITRP